MRQLAILAALASISLVFVGCTPQSKDDYSEAGHDLVKSGKETGKALSSDAHQAVKELDKAGDKAKNAVDKKDKSGN